MVDKMHTFCYKYYMDPGEITASFTGHERQPNAERVGIATTTLYPAWYPGTDGPLTADKVRGDLALSTTREAIAQGYNLVVVDGGSSAGFRQALAASGATVQKQAEPGMSAGRRQALASTSNIEGVDVLCWTEPEKVSLVRDCMAEPVSLILDGKADIVVPSRDDSSFATYPAYQAEFEKDSNAYWNGILRRHRVLPAEAEPLDAWIGPRFIKNDPELLQLFQARYEFAGERTSRLEKDSPELWSNAIFLPLIAALVKKYHVRSVPVPYVHPPQQTAFEQDSPQFEDKRAAQQRSILVTTIHYLRQLEGNPASRLQSK